MPNSDHPETWTPQQVLPPPNQDSDISLPRESLDAIISAGDMLSTFPATEDATPIGYNRNYAYGQTPPWNTGAYSGSLQLHANQQGNAATPTFPLGFYQQDSSPASDSPFVFGHNISQASAPRHDTGDSYGVHNASDPLDSKMETSQEQEQNMPPRQRKRSLPEDLYDDEDAEGEKDDTQDYSFNKRPRF
jgi:hypothetical protein